MKTLKNIIKLIGIVPPKRVFKKLQACSDNSKFSIFSNFTATSSTEPLIHKKWAWNRFDKPIPSMRNLQKWEEKIRFKNIFYYF